jgi:hypothetical protein
VNSPSEAIVEEVLAFEPVALAPNGSRRAHVRWSDGTVDEAVRCGTTRS